MLCRCYFFFLFIVLYLEERKKQRWDCIKSTAEAKYALYFLFNAVSKSKKELMNLNDIVKELKVLFFQ